MAKKNIFEMIEEELLSSVNIDYLEEEKQEELIYYDDD